MKTVFWIDDIIFSPLGDNTESNYHAVLEQKSSIIHHPVLSATDKSFFGSLFDTAARKQIEESTPNPTLSFFEKMCVNVIKHLLAKHPVENLGKTLFILSTTKGNIEFIHQADKIERLSLSNAAQHIAQEVGFGNSPFVVSNACVSGISALIAAKRFIESGSYDSVIVCGADVITDFVAAGFQSLSATANEVCRPYNNLRTGINLGEAACAVLLSSKIESPIQVKGGSITNDANHISGPSKTGEELAVAIRQTLSESEAKIEDIAFVSAHGTATVYNDEMESKAFELAGLSNVLVNSLKPHFGHTLGAAGVIETIVSLKALEEGIILPSLHANEVGVSGKINVCTEKRSTSKKSFIKTASGFGGCNAAILISKL